MAGRPAGKSSSSWFDRNGACAASRAVPGAIFAVVLLLLAGFPLQASAQKIITGDQLKEDITEAYDLLKKFHPNLVTHTGRKTMDALYRRLLDAAPPGSSTEEAYYIRSELFGAVCDEHTITMMNHWDGRMVPDGWPMFTHPLVLQDGKLFFEDSKSGKKEEIVTINGMAGQEIADQLIRRIPRDGCSENGTVYINDGWAIGFRVLSHIFGDAKTFQVQSRRVGSDDLLDRVVEAVDIFEASTQLDKFQSDQSAYLNAHLKQKDFRRLLLSHQADRADMQLHWSKARNAAYLRIGSFVSSDKSKEGIDIVMREIIERNPDVLFIDLVNNSGGSTRAAQLVMAYLLPRAHRLHSHVRVRNVSKKQQSNFSYFDDEAERTRSGNVAFFRQIKARGGIRSTWVKKASFGKPDYKGKIYVLLGPESRSNSIRVAAALKRLRKATIAGSTTALDTVDYCARANGTFTLKHTRIKVRIPEICMQHRDNNFNAEHTIEPDIAVDPLKVPVARMNAETVSVAVRHHERSLQN